MKQYLLAGCVFLIPCYSVMAQDIPLSKILVENEGWKEVAKAKGFADPKDITTSKGRYEIKADSKGISFIDASGKKNVLKLKSGAPTCLTLWPDSGHIVVGVAKGLYLWAVRIESDGTFGPGDRYYSLRAWPDQKLSVTAMTMDAGGLLYACTPLGVQIFDPIGRLCGDGNQLLIECGTQVFSRQIQGKAIPRAEK